MLHSQHPGHDEGSDKSCRKEIGFTLFNPGSVKHIWHTYPPRFKFNPTQLGQAGHPNVTLSGREGDHAQRCPMGLCGAMECSVSGLSNMAATWGL